MAQASVSNHFQAHRRRALRGRQRRCVLGPGVAGLRGEGLSLRVEGIRGVDQVEGQVEAGDAWAPWRALRRLGAAQGGRDNRPNQERRGPRREARVDGYGGGRGGALSQGACRAALQAEHREAVPKRGESLHPACLRSRRRRVGRSRAHRRPALRASRHSVSGEPGAGDREQAVQPRRVVEASHGQQPVQVRAQVPGEEARAVPHRRGVPASRRRLERDGGGQDAACVPGGGDSPADADGVPTQRDRDGSQMGARGSRGRRASSRGLQDGCAHGAAVAGGGAGAGGASAHQGQPWVIPGFKPTRHLADLNHYWDRVRERADLQDVRIHDIRHSFASRALALGESLSMIGKLLGHKKIDTTSRYAHLARDSIKASSARVADSIGADILNRKPREAEVTA